MPLPLAERRIISVVLFLVTAALIVSTFGLQFADLGGAFSPMFFPRIVLFILLGLTAVNLALDLKSRDAPGDIHWGAVAVISLALVIYVLGIGPLGFFISSSLVGVVILLALGLRDPLRVALVPVLVALALVVLFNHVLKMPLPTSPFVWWI